MSVNDTVQTALAQSIIQLCKSHNIQHIVISPGSRNAPLTIGFTNHDFFECYSIVDERSAGFFALGMAQQLATACCLGMYFWKCPCQLLSLRYRSVLQSIPLVVISADRPEHLINIGDGQTITQPHIFGSHILFEANLKDHFKKPFLKAVKNNNSLIDKALQLAKSESGPVHINVPFSEPLYETTEELISEVKPD